MGPCLFLPDHLSYLSQRKTQWTMSVHLLGFKTHILGTLTSVVPLPFSSSVNRSCPGTSSTANQGSKIAMGQPHGP